MNNCDKCKDKYVCVTRRMSLCEEQWLEEEYEEQRRNSRAWAEAELRDRERMEQEEKERMEREYENGSYSS